MRKGVSSADIGIRLSRKQADGIRFRKFRDGNNLETAFFQVGKQSFYGVYGGRIALVHQYHAAVQKVGDDFVVGFALSAGVADVVRSVFSEIGQPNCPPYRCARPAADHANSLTE